MEKEVKNEILDAINTFATGVDKRFDAVDKRFDIIESRLDDLTEEVRQIKTDIKSIRERLDEIEEKLEGSIRMSKDDSDAISGDVIDLRRRVEFLENQVREMQAS